MWEGLKELLNDGDGFRQQLSGSGLTHRRIRPSPPRDQGKQKQGRAREKKDEEKEEKEKGKQQSNEDGCVVL